MIRCVGAPLIVLIALPARGARPRPPRPRPGRRDVAPIVYRALRRLPSRRAARRRSRSTSYDDARSRAQLIARGDRDAATCRRGCRRRDRPTSRANAASRRRRSPCCAELGRGRRAVRRSRAPRRRRLRHSHEGWRLGEPDLVVEMAEPFTLPAAGDDVFRGFVLPVDLGGARRRWVRGGGDRARRRASGAPRHLDGGSDRLVATARRRRCRAGLRRHAHVLAGARCPTGTWWAGRRAWRPRPGSDDLAWELAAGTDLVLELHLLPSGREETVARARRPSLRARRRRRARPLALRLGLKTIDIAGGRGRVSRSRTASSCRRRWTCSRSTRTRTTSCRSMRATATLARRTRARRCSTSRAWDFDWQDQYRYRDPIRLPAGTELAMEYVFDNSAANARNPHQPPRRVVYGPAASDEMGDLWLQVVAGRRRRCRSPDPRARAPRERVEPGGLARGAGARARRRHCSTSISAASWCSPPSSTRESPSSSAQSRLDPALGRAHTNLGNAFVARAQRSGGEAATPRISSAPSSTSRAPRR